MYLHGRHAWWAAVCSSRSMSGVGGFGLRADHGARRHVRRQAPHARDTRASPGALRTAPQLWSICTQYACSGNRSQHAMQSSSQRKSTIWRPRPGVGLFSEPSSEPDGSRVAVTPSDDAPVELGLGSADRSERAVARRCWVRSQLTASWESGASRTARSRAVSKQASKQVSKFRVGRE